MSHYTLGVILDELDENILEKTLEPYSENLEVEPYIEETKQQIINIAKKKKNDYLKEYISNKENIKDWQKGYINAKTDEELYLLECDEYEKYDKDGNKLSTYNPLSKWDWYVIGGRWDGELRVKDGWVNFSKIKDIEFDKMPEKKEAIYKDAILYWELFVDEREPINDEEIEYKKNEFCLFKKEYYLKKYGTKENYANISSTWFTHSLLYENQWYEGGEMGWFGCDDGDKDSQGLYLDKFNEIIHDPKNQDKYLVIVDCHI